MIKLLHGDFLEEAKNIPDDSVDLVLTDPPYGTVKGLQLQRQKENAYGWDDVIEPKEMFEVINRILRKNGKAVLFGQEPFTSRMITEAIPNLPFSYRMIWEKNSFANGLLAKKAPVNYYEDVMVFSKAHPKHDFEGRHPLRDYFSDTLDFIGIPKGKIIKEVGQRAVNVFRVNTTQFAMCTEETYKELIKRYRIDKMRGFRQYEDLRRTDVEYRQRLIDDMNREYPSVFNIWEEEPVESFEDVMIFNKKEVSSTFNLWQKKKTKSNILKYARDYTGYHPTQKPVLLLEDLIKTFSNEGDTVVDLTMGSGSTGVACQNTGRKFIGIELDDEYFNIAKERIEEHEEQLTLV